MGFKFNDDFSWGFLYIILILLSRQTRLPDAPEEILHLLV